MRAQGTFSQSIKSEESQEKAGYGHGTSLPEVESGFVIGFL
jgi:hypothetical protein